MHEISWNWVHRRLENATIRHRPRSALAARARGHSSHRDGTMRGWKIHGRSWGQKRSLCQGKTTRDEATKLSNWQVWTMPPKRMASPSSSPFPCRYENAIYAECSNTFCGLILLMKGKKKQCPRSCFPYFFPFHLGSCQSLSNQRVWSGFIPELQADTSGDPYQNPPVTWLGNPQSKWRTRGLGKSSQKCAIC